MHGHRAEIAPTGLNRRRVVDFLSNTRGDLILERWGGGNGAQESLVFAFERIRERDLFVDQFGALPGETGEIIIPVHRAVDPNLSTPRRLAQAIVDHFQPQGSMLEPCAGSGAFLDCMEGAEWCEIEENRDFFSYAKLVDWIITNPPYEQRLEFLVRSLQLAKNIIFLIQVPSLFFQAKLHLITKWECGIREIVLIDNPPDPWPFFDMRLGVVHIKKGHRGGIKLTDKRGDWPVDFD